MGVRSRSISSFTKYMKNNSKKIIMTLVSGFVLGFLLTVSPGSVLAQLQSYLLSNFLRVDGGALINNISPAAPFGLVIPGGNVRIGTSTPSNYPIDVYGILNAKDFYKNGAPAENSPWVRLGNAIHFDAGNVGIRTGNNLPSAKLQIVGDLRIDMQTANLLITDLAGYFPMNINGQNLSAAVYRALYDSTSGSYRTRTVSDCVSDGGTPVLESGSQINKICRFNGSSCPAGWVNYGNWSTTSENSCSGRQCIVLTDGTECSTGSHAWADTPAELCNYDIAETDPSGSFTCFTSYSAVCNSTIVQVGCY